MMVDLFSMNRSRLWAPFYHESLFMNWDDGLVRMISPWKGIFNRVPLGLVQVS